MPRGRKPKMSLEQQAEALRQQLAQVENTIENRGGGIETALERAETITAAWAERHAEFAPILEEFEARYKEFKDYRDSLNKQMVELRADTTEALGIGVGQLPPELRIRFNLDGTTAAIGAPAPLPHGTVPVTPDNVAGIAKKH